MTTHVVRDYGLVGGPHLASGDRCLEELGAFAVDRAVHALHILEVHTRRAKEPVVFIATCARMESASMRGNLLQWIYTDERCCAKVENSSHHSRIEQMTK